MEALKRQFVALKENLDKREAASCFKCLKVKGDQSVISEIHKSILKHCQILEFSGSVDLLNEKELHKDSQDLHWKPVSPLFYSSPGHQKGKTSCDAPGFFTEPLESVAQAKKQPNNGKASTSKGSPSLKKTSGSREPKKNISNSFIPHVKQLETNIKTTLSNYHFKMNQTPKNPSSVPHKMTTSEMMNAELAVESKMFSPLPFSNQNSTRSNDKNRQMNRSFSSGGSKNLFLLPNCEEKEENRPSRKGTQRLSSQDRKKEETTEKITSYSFKKNRNSSLNYQSSKASSSAKTREEGSQSTTYNPSFTSGVLLTKAQGQPQLFNGPAKGSKAENNSSLSNNRYFSTKDSPLTPSSNAYVDVLSIARASNTFRPNAAELNKGKTRNQGNSSAQNSQSSNSNSNTHGAAQKELLFQAPSSGHGMANSSANRGDSKKPIGTLAASLAKSTKHSNQNVKKLFSNDLKHLDSSRKGSLNSPSPLNKPPTSTLETTSANAGSFNVLSGPKMEILHGFSAKKPNSYLENHKKISKSPKMTQSVNYNSGRNISSALVNPKRNISPLKKQKTTNI